jgi:hypothetical protein
VEHLQELIPLEPEEPEEPEEIEVMSGVEDEYIVPVVRLLRILRVHHSLSWSSIFELIALVARASLWHEDVVDVDVTSSLL